MKADKKTSKLIKESTNKLFASAQRFITDLNYVLKHHKNVDVHFEEAFAIQLTKLEIHPNRFFDAEKILLNNINEINCRPEQAVHSIKLLSKLYLSQQQLDKAQILIDDKISEFEHAGNIKSTIEHNFEKGKLYFQSGELSNAINLFSELIENHTNSFSTENLGELYYWAGSAYLWSGELDVSVNYLNAAKKISKEYAVIYTEIKCSLVQAGLNIMQNKPEIGMEQLKFAYSNIDSSNVSHIEINILTLYACNHFIQNENNKCIEYLNRAIALLSNTELKSKYYLLFKLLSSAYQKLEQFDDAKDAENKCLTYLEDNSKIGKGHQALLYNPAFSIFEIAVNHALKHSSIKQNASLIDSTTKTINILAIDDNKLNLFFTRKILSNKGYQAHIASNITEVKKLLAKNEMDVILMDIQMPVMNGYEMFETLLNENLIDKQKTKVVAMTGYDSDKDKERAYKLGMDDYLTKPFTPEQLNACVNKLINQKMDPIESVLQNQTYSYSSLLEDKYGFNEAESQKFLGLLSKQFKNTERLIYESISLQDCNELLQVMHDLKSNAQMINETKALKLINQIINNTINTESLIQNVPVIESLVSVLNKTQRNMSDELNQR